MERDDCPAGASRRCTLIGAAAAALASVPGGAAAAAFERRFRADAVISADDIAWFRTCRSLWVESESGAPAIFPPGVTPQTFAKVPITDLAAYEARMEPLLCAFFLHASFEPGRHGFAAPLDGRSAFEVTPEHVTLLKITNWQTFAIHPKRPYGDYTNYPIDMARALGIPVAPDAEGYDAISPEEDARMEAVHREIHLVLQAYVEHARLEPGAWFIPEDGWEGIVQPRCRPVSAAAIATYRAARDRIAARAPNAKPGDLVTPIMRAAEELFGSP